MEVRYFPHKLANGPGWLYFFPLILPGMNESPICSPLACGGVIVSDLCPSKRGGMVCYSYTPCSSLRIKHLLRYFLSVGRWSCWSVSAQIFCAFCSRWVVHFPIVELERIFVYFGYLFALKKFLISMKSNLVIIPHRPCLWSCI